MLPLPLRMEQQNQVTFDFVKGDPSLPKPLLCLADAGL